LSLLQTIGLIPSYKSSLKRFVLVQPGHPLENDSEKTMEKPHHKNEKPTTGQWSLSCCLF
jgi:hypothetical protein